MTSFGEDAESNREARPITIGAFGTGEFHPLVLDSRGAMQKEHTKKSRTQKGEREPPSMDNEEQVKRRRTGRKLEKSGHVHM